MRRYPSGVTIVSTRTADGTPYGLTVSSFTSVSLDPPLVLVCLDGAASGLGHFEDSGHYAVSLLAGDQEVLSEHFATAGTDRSSCDYEEGPTGLPLIRGALATLECRITEVLSGGDHSILIGEVLRVNVGGSDPARAPLVYWNGRYFSLK